MRRAFQVLAARLRLALRVPLDTETERRNYWYAVVEGALATVTVQIVTTFTPVFAIALGATNQQVGLIYSFPFLFNIAGLLLTVRYTRQRERHLAVGQGTAVLHRVLIVLFIVAPLLGRFGVWWLLLLYSVASAAMSVSSVFWQAIVSDMFPPERRGIVFGTRSMYTGLAGLLAVMLSGRLLDLLGYPQNYVLVLSLAALVGFAAAHYYGKLEPPTDEESPKNATVPAAGFRLRPFLRTAGGRSFLGLTLAVALFNLGFHMASPIVTIYFVEYLGYSNALIGVLTAASVLFQVFGSRVWGALADRWGLGVVLVATTALMAVQAAGFWLVPSVLFLLVMQAVGGFALAGYNVATLNALFLVGDRQSRPGLILWYNVIVGLANFAGPQLGTGALSRLSLPAVFLLTGGLRALGALAMVRRGAEDLSGLRQLRKERLQHRKGSGRRLAG